MDIREVTEACIGAGFRGDALVEIVAIAGRESNWSEAIADTRAFSERGEDGIWRNPDTGAALDPGIGPEYSVGPFQINLNVHPLSYDDAMDPNTSAAYAFTLSQGGADFSPWSTERGLPESFRDQARAAILDVTGQPADEFPRGAGDVIETPVESAPIGGGSEFEGRSVTLDVAQAHTALIAASQLVNSGAPMFAETEPDGRVSLVLTVPRDTLTAAWPAFAEFLPA